MSDCTNCPKTQAIPKQRWVAPQREVQISGILNVDKPRGMTSHDVVDAIRRVAGQRRVGHAGTLDPMATGVLLVCLGQATRVAEYLMASPKRYRATLVLGTSTDTFDVEGKVLSSGGRTDLAWEEIEAALAGFRGRIEQVPPMYSALKRKGQALYSLARQGKTVEREPRLVEIDEAVIVEWTPPSLIIEIACSPGTYVRSLAHDLGQRLGSGAFLAALVRLSSGGFALEEAVSLERLEEAFQYGQEESYLLPLDEALLDWPAMIVCADDARRIAHGQAIQDDPPAASPAGRSDRALGRAYSLDGDLIAIVAYDPATGQWRPEKVFST